MIDLKKISLTVGIAVLFSLFVFVTIDAFYPEPEYEDFCHRADKYGYYEHDVIARPLPVGEYYEGNVVKKANCTPIPRKIHEECGQNGGHIVTDYDENNCPINPKCNTCSKDYDEARERYNLNVFYIAAPIGVIALIVGMYLPLIVEAIASGFMFGGIVTLLISTAMVFDNLGKWSKVIVIGLELILIVWVGLKKVSDYKPKSNKNTKKSKKQSKK